MRSNLLSSVVTLLLLVAARFSAVAGAVITSAEASDEITDNSFRGRMLMMMKRNKRRGKPRKPPNVFLEKSNPGSPSSSKSKTKNNKSFKLPNGRQADPDEDTGLRYQKFDMYENKAKPVATYPLSQELSKLLRYYSNAFSPVTSDDPEMRGRNCTTHIEKIGYPPRPFTDKFWQEFRYVCKVQLLRREGELPPEWTAPDLWESYNVYEVAEKVHDEYPGGNQAALLFSWFANRKDIHLDYDILPFRCIDDFIGTEVRLAAILSWAIQTVAPINFCAKWYCGQLRPEEMAWLITSDEIAKEDVPEDIYDMVIDMNLTKATDFTQYPEGSPNHPSWPAMHSAASNMSLWLAVVANLTDEQYCQVLRTDYAVSFARTCAGVHYVNDNVAGLNMGQEIVADELIQYLVSVYGASEDAVRKKIKKFRFDWNNFDPEKCTTS